MHAVTAEWKLARKAALTARATAVGDLLDHLSDVEDMLETTANGPSEDILRTMRELAARLRTLAREYESEAGKIDG